MILSLILFFLITYNNNNKAIIKNILTLGILLKFLTSDGSLISVLLKSSIYY